MARKTETAGFDESYGNGLGPSWWPECLRRYVTTRAHQFGFMDLDWAEHDYHYTVADVSRRDADMILLCRLLEHSRQNHGIFKRLEAVFVALTIWESVRLGGWLSYNKKKG